MKNPFYSVLIPTYNRSSTLKCAIKSVLLQDFDDFEIIIVDDASTDNTKKAVESFQDKRIKYYRNRKNLGAEGNMKKAFNYPRGRYLFTLGDDDYILFQDTLSQVKKVIDRKNLGFVRLNLIEKKFIGSGLRKSIISVESDILIDRHSAPEKIIEFFNKTAAGHYAGLVIKNRPNLGEEMIDCRETDWIKIIFEATQKYGAYFLGRHYIIITWSQAGILHHYDVGDDNRLMFENYTDYIFQQIPKVKLETYQHHFYQKFILLQPVIKLYSDNKNLLKFNRKLFQLDKTIKRTPLFWIFLSIALVFPKPFWRLIRVIQHHFKNHLSKLKNLTEINKRYHYLETLFNQTIK